MRDKAPENVAQMMQSVAAVGLAMRTSTRPMWLFVQSDTAKEGFTAAVGLAWQRVVHAANYLCDPAVSCRSPDMKLQLMRPDMVKKLAEGINNIRYVHFLRRSGAPMTKTGTLCSHGSISHSIEELWSMPCIISWASVLQAAFHSRPLLIVCSPLSSTAAEPLGRPPTRFLLFFFFFLPSASHEVQYHLSITSFKHTQSTWYHSSGEGHSSLSHAIMSPCSGCRHVQYSSTLSDGDTSSSTTLDGDTSSASGAGGGTGLLGGRGICAAMKSAR